MEASRVYLNCYSAGQLAFVHELLRHHARAFAFSLDPVKRAFRRVLANICKQLEAKPRRRDRDPQTPAYLDLPALSRDHTLVVAAAFLGLEEIARANEAITKFYSAEALDALTAICRGVAGALVAAHGVTLEVAEQLAAANIQAGLDAMHRAEAGGGN